MVRIYNQGDIIMSATAVTSTNFDTTVLQSDIPVLLDFWAPWCGPCVALAPALDEVASDRGDTLKVVKVNVDENQELAGRFAVRGIPTLLLFKGGEVVGQKVGAAGKADLESWVDSVLG